MHYIDPEDNPYDPSKLPLKREVSINDFSSLDLRVGYIVAVELLLDAAHPAYCLDVDFGSVVGTLRTVSQLTSYPADALFGRAIVGVLNVGVHRVAGVECQFLSLAVLRPDGTPLLVEPDGNPPAGAPFG